MMLANTAHHASKNKEKTICRRSQDLGPASRRRDLGGATRRLILSKAKILGGGLRSHMTMDDSGQEGRKAFRIGVKL